MSNQSSLTEARPVAQNAATCHVYVARLSSSTPNHLGVLDERETDRRSRYRFGLDRDRFTLGAVILRAVVARHCGVDPSSVAVIRTCQDCGADHGRPRVHYDGVELSVSHSDDVVAVALSTAGPVGVDVESPRRLDYGDLVSVGLRARGGEVPVRVP